MSSPFDEQVERIIDLALTEDISHGDITSHIMIPPKLKGNASIIAKACGILAGGDIARRVLLKVEPTLKVNVIIQDGEKIRTGKKVIEFVGSIAGILKGERVALNFMSHLSGIASETAKYISQIKESKAIIVDTRKTIPGLRMLEKYAVRIGGGQNHRLDLGDGILIKDNHIAALRQLGMDIKDIITKARKKAPDRMKIEIETNTFADAVEAAAAGADIIMLDNITPNEMRRIAEAIKGQTKLEASGNINLDSIRAVAMTGVDFISIGAITHSAKAIDFSLELKLS